ncbi:hypothetical protein LG634_27815 [Streptomyces bambusae]|uniref:hypothetical protein n=1 Tax=Streptomyces bambusae TaxID=1550616 RepID=UPI001CFF1C41|nr:hypothetical protein [Streptomyces bambusae]MCB5168615.1 hypothetical protein [Streptomyces bambusae]
MADDRYEWLDGAAAEKLLRGEPVDPVAPGAGRHGQDIPQPGAEDAAHAARVRDDAARLARALESLVPPCPPAGSGELPGEAAAVAAFRAAHAAAPAPAAAPGADTELPAVRLGAPAPADVVPLRGRVRRPLRLGLAAAVAAVTIGGVAAAATTGLLPDPRDVAGPPTTVTVSSGPSPEPTGPGGTESAGTGEPADRLLVDGLPSGSPSASAAGTQGVGPSPDDSGSPAATAGPSGGTGDKGGTVESPARLAAFCRDLRAGRLAAEKRIKLERAARGSRVEKYCDALIGKSSGGAGGGAAGGASGGSGGSGTRPGEGATEPTPPVDTTPGDRGGVLPTLGFGRPSA